MAKRKQKGNELVPVGRADYDGLLSGLSALLDQSRRSAARAANAVLAATYWEVGRCVVEFEQGGRERAGYGEELLKRLGADISKRLGRGFGWRNLFSMRAFYLGWEIVRTPSGRFELRAKLFGTEKLQTVSAISPK